MQITPSNGANYTFPGCFTVETLVGKQSKLGDHQHWTVQEFLDLADSSDISMFSGMSRELFLFYMEQYLLDAFLDEETKTCSFDSEEFRSLLDYAATLAEPEELEFEAENSMLLIRRDLALAEPVILSSVGQMHSAESYTVGEPLAWIGWPGPNGTKVRPDAEIAVFKIPIKQTVRRPFCNSCFQTPARRCLGVCVPDDGIHV